MLTHLTFCPLIWIEWSVMTLIANVDHEKLNPVLYFNGLFTEVLLDGSVILVSFRLQA